MKKALNLLVFILLGLSLSAPGEVLNQLLGPADKRPFDKSLQAFGSTVISYVILLFIGYFAFAGISRLARRRSRAALVYYLLFGSLGLMVEWRLLGNAPNFHAPFSDPFQIVTQPGMFTFWGTMVLGPKLLMESAEFAALKKAFARFFVVFSGLYLVVAVVIPRNMGGIYFGFIGFAAGSVTLNYFYVQYFRRLEGMTATAPVANAGLR